MGTLRQPTSVCDMISLFINGYVRMRFAEGLGDVEPVALRLQYS